MPHEEPIRGLMIVTPIYTPPGQAVSVTLVDRLRELSHVGERLPVVAQGANIDHVLMSAEVMHSDEPLGIWGAVYAADAKIREAIQRHDVDAVALNLAPNYYSGFSTRMLAEMALYSMTPHAVGRRRNIAASLNSKARALAECFLTYLAEIILGREGALRDGFSGLHVISGARWLNWDWSWIEATTWGGALEAQCQSITDGEEVDYYPIPHLEERTWVSTLGDHEKRAVFSMLTRALKPPVFRGNIRHRDLRQAAFMVAERFRSQTWIDPATAEKEIYELVGFYNSQQISSMLLPL